MIAAFLMIFICVLIVSISFGLLKEYVFEKDLAVVFQVFSMYDKSQINVDACQTQNT